MGTIKQLICKNCNHEWELFTGYGMGSIIYICNSCNRQLTVDPGNINKSIPNCDCGGKFVIDPEHYICPVCKKKDIEIMDIGLWD